MIDLVPEIKKAIQNINGDPSLTPEDKLEKIKNLKANGIIKGGSLDNAVVFGTDGTLNEEGLRTINEPAKHKALDAIGDLFLTGNSVLGHIQAYCAGHSLMHLAVKEIFSDASNWEIITLSEQPDYAIMPDQFSTSTVSL